MKSGFTLIETIVAVFILTAGILGSYLVFYNIYSQSGGYLHKLTAGYLAQEGIEIIRNMRDNNWVKNPNDSWMTGIIDDNDCNMGREFEADYRTGTINSVTGLKPYGNFLNIDSSGMYLYDSNYPETIFKRKITITCLSDFEVQVSSEVFWQYNNKEFSIKIDDFMYNWY